jgi:serine phosphatase RsbU (regulator of sigma subunit)
VSAAEEPERGRGAAAPGDPEALLREALTARALAEAAEARAELARGDAEAAMRAAEAGYQAADAARRRHEFLSSAGTLMAGSMDYRTTLEQVAKAAVPVLAEWCAITVTGDDGRPRTLTVAHADPEREARARELLGRHPPQAGAPFGMAKVLYTGRFELLRDVTEEHLLAAAREDPARMEALRWLAPREVLTVPLRTPSQAVGTITFGLSDPERSFADEDVEVAVSLAARAALHVQNARMYTERSRIAHTLQRSLLPTEPPDIPGLDVAARYRAAGAQYEVGGDFYDVFPSGSGVWTAFVGDVSGKGAEAAALTALTRHTLFAAALRSEDPAEHLRLANDALRARGQASRFATLVHARVCPGEDGALVTVTNAGHPPPFHVGPDGDVEELDAHGTVLGVVDDPRLEQVEVSLGPGELLLLYTDGVTELRGRPLQFGLDQLVATLRSRARCTAAAVAEAIERHSLELSQGTPADDMALLVLRVPSFS